MSENITEILHKIRRDSWGQKLKDIKDAIKKYDEVQTGRSGDSNDEIVEHLNNILPTYWDVFHTHNTSRRRNGELLKRDDNDEACLPSYDIGVFLVGYSSLPIALSLAEIQPTEQIYFLYSSDTKPMLLEIGDRLQKMLGDSHQCFVDRVATTALSNQEDSALAIDNPSDPVATFKRIKEIIDNIDDADNKRIALDLTGGKKTMLGGGYTAGAIWASRWSEAAQELVPFCDMYYIDSLEYNSLQGSPKPGTEFLSRLVNPYDVYNVQSNLQARKLFEKHNYEAAADLWEDVKQNLEDQAAKYSLEAEQKAVQGTLGMTKCYRFWDAFDYNAAKKYQFFLFDKNRKGYWGYSEKHTKNQIDVLEILSAMTDRTTLFNNEQQVIHYAVDRYQNAIRRMENGKLEDAIIRFTQVAELLCIYKICRGIYSVNGEQIPETFLQDPGPVKTLIRFFFKNPDQYRNRYNVDQNEFLQLRDYNGFTRIKEITDLIEYRNDSVHINNPVNYTEGKNIAVKLRNFVKQFMENFSYSYRCCHSLSFRDLLDLHKFRSASLSAIKQLAAELAELTENEVDQEYAIQIYNEHLPSLEGNDKHKIAQALKTYWQCINRWDGGSDKQRKKVMDVKSILGEN